MFCKHCGKAIEEEGIFCEFCGGKINDKKPASETQPEESKNEKTDTSIWDKFTDIYNSKDKEREQYLRMTSDEIWEVIGKLPVNSYESFLKTNKDALNKQPYKGIEAIEQAFKGSFLAGYWVCLAENLLKNPEPKKAAEMDLSKIGDEWAKIVEKEQPDLMKRRPELGIPFMNMLEHRIEILFESSPSIKDLPNEIIENLRGELVVQIMWGYMLGLTENKHRK